jgi:hypothetical protein
MRIKDMFSKESRMKLIVKINNYRKSNHIEFKIDTTKDLKEQIRDYFRKNGICISSDFDTEEFNRAVAVPLSNGSIPIFMVYEINELMDDLDILRTLHEIGHYFEIKKNPSAGTEELADNFVIRVAREQGLYESEIKEIIKQNKINERNHRIEDVWKKMKSLL